MAGRTVHRRRIILGHQPAEPGWLLTPQDEPELKETDVVRQICDLLKARGWMLYRCHVGKFVPSRCVTALVNAFRTGTGIEKAVDEARRSIITIGRKGQSDYLAVHAVHGPLFVEFKRPGGVIRKEQMKFFREMTEAYRFRAVIVDNYEEFLAWYMATYHPGGRLRVTVKASHY